MAAPSSFSLALALIMTGLTACTGTVGADGPSDPGLDSDETALLDELNNIRIAAGETTPLIACPSLSKSAAAHSDDMRDNNYLADDAPDGSTVRSRSCAAGYSPACTQAAALGELDARGIDTGKDTVAKWASKADSNAILVNSVFVVAGTGKALAADGTALWTLILASMDDSSCH